jgi:hypothetical protein
MKPTAKPSGTTGFRPADLGEPAGELERTFAAHLVLRVVSSDNPGAIVVREVICLVHAPNCLAADRAAADLGPSFNGQVFDTSAAPNGVATFLGVRKVHEICTGRVGHHGLEVTDFQLELDEERDIYALLEGDFVRPVFEW